MFLTRLGPVALFVSLALAAADRPARVDFEKDVRPLLESHCRPCHFEGGKMYAKLPFDRPETITRLGTKLFTRIKKEEDQRLIREFLAQEEKTTGKGSSGGATRRFAASR